MADVDVRGDVARGFDQSKQVVIQGSPQIIWPDGGTTHYPGMSDHYWRGGLLLINSTDPGRARASATEVRSVRPRSIL